MGKEKKLKSKITEIQHHNGEIEQESKQKMENLKVKDKMLDDQSETITNLKRELKDKVVYYNFIFLI